MSVAISRVPAATTLQDMRSRGPPEDRERRGHLSYCRRQMVLKEDSAHEHSRENKGPRPGRGGTRQRDLDWSLALSTSAPLCCPSKRAVEAVLAECRLGSSNRD